MRAIAIPTAQDSAPLLGGGAQGFQGSPGSVGSQGNQGATGSGAQGAQGSPGSQGNQGDPGSQGNQGVAGGGAGSDDGWTAAGVTFTYASSTTFTVPGDLTTTYTKGSKLKLTQTTPKYFSVVTSSHSVGTTTVTVTGGTDYTLANAAITLPYHSKLTAPSGFPDWFNFTVGFTGFSVNPTGLVNRFRIEGTTCTCTFRQTTPGTSNSTSFTMTGAPVAAKTVANASWFGSMWGQNAGVTAMHFVVIDSNTSTFLCATASGGGSGWTGSGAKACHTGTLMYEF